MKKFTVLAVMLMFAFSLTACDLFQKDDVDTVDDATSEDIAVGLTIGEGSVEDLETIAVGLTIADNVVEDIPVALTIEE